MRIGQNASEFQHPDPGTVSAVCTRIIDLGTQENKQGKKKRMVMLGWEIDQKMEDGRPFLVSSRFPANTSPQALLGSMLESWRGSPLSEAELNDFDLGKLLGAGCLLTIMREGNYTNVKTVVGLVKGMKKLEIHGPFVHLDLDNFCQEMFDSLSDALKATIQKSPEYARLSADQHKNIDGKLDADDIAF